MQDRFYGFRFLIHGAAAPEALQLDIQAEADELAGFGWTQLRRDDGAVVGEFRGSRRSGKAMQDFLQGLEMELDGVEVEVKVYQDTKIYYHPSHFRIFHPDRDTCFPDPPHQCPGMEESTSSSSSSSPVLEEL